jgi:hypothetical protein
LEDNISAVRYNDAGWTHLDEGRDHVSLDFWQEPMVSSAVLSTITHFKQFVISALYNRFIPWKIPLAKRLDGLQGQSGRCGEAKNLLFLPGIETRFLCSPAP